MVYTYTFTNKFNKGRRFIIIVAVETHKLSESYKHAYVIDYKLLSFQQYQKKNSHLKQGLSIYAPEPASFMFFPVMLQRIYTHIKLE